MCLYFLPPSARFALSKVPSRFPKTPQESNSNQTEGNVTKGVCLVLYNARPHMANSTKTLLNSFGWDQPVYSQDLAPSDFHLFTFLKTHLGGKNVCTMSRRNEMSVTRRRIWWESSMRRKSKNC